MLAPINYICPACLFLDHKKVVISCPSNDYLLKCAICLELSSKISSISQIKLRKTFAVHFKQGFHCGNCQRFVPRALDNSLKIICPYVDCFFVGDYTSLNRAHHPTLKTKRFNSNSISILSEQGESQDQQSFPIEVSLLQSIIQDQQDLLPYRSHTSTLSLKQLAFQAIDNLLQQFPQQMTDYLVYQSRSGGFQHKIFQEYIKLLEEKLPFSIYKNKQFVEITSLLDPSLSIFDGISAFSCTPEDNIIKNQTSEYYIGGRMGSYIKPFYIGKLLDVLDNDKSVISLVQNYSFSKIRLLTNYPYLLTIKHLRIAPHYQLGGMSYINRARQAIVKAMSDNNC